MKNIILIFTLIHYSVDSFLTARERSAAKYLSEFYDYEKSLGSMEESIKKLQKMIGIEEDGKLSDEVLSYMNKPRCGLKDFERNHKRYVLFNSKWDSGVTYKYHLHLDWMPVTLSEPEVRKAIKIAFNYWVKEANLDFQESLQKTGAAFSLSFAGLLHPLYFVANNFQKGNCDISSWANTPGGVLAHAFSPRNGNVHFDNAETWTEDTHDGINLRMVAAHEIGHAIGLDHSNDFRALMAPWYGGYIPDKTFKLPKDDRNGIKSLYGTRGKRTELYTKKREQGKLQLALCKSKNFNSVFHFSDNRIYVIADNSKIFRLDGKKVDESFEPAEINAELKTADSLFYDEKNERLIIFKGEKVISAFGSDINNLKTEELVISGHGAFQGKATAAFSRDTARHEEMQYFWLVEDNELISGELLGNKVIFGRRAHPLTNIIMMNNGAKLPSSIDAAYLSDEKEELELYLFIGNSYYVGKPTGRRQVKYSISAQYPQPYKSFLNC